MTRAEFGALLRQRREAENVSQDALAERLGTKQQILGSWELGRSLPTGEAADNVCAYMGIDRMELEKIRDTERRRAKTNISGNIQTGKNVISVSGQELSPEKAYLLKLIDKHGGDGLIEELIALILSKK